MRVAARKASTMQHGWQFPEMRTGLLPAQLQKLEQAVVEVKLVLHFLNTTATAGKLLPVDFCDYSETMRTTRWQLQVAAVAAAVVVLLVLVMRHR